jgi:5-methylcytosine-specific restriction endonuclease McrA
MTSVREALAQPKGVLSADAVATLEHVRALMRAQRPDDATAKAARSERRLKSFYNGWPWKKLRYQVLRDRGRKCECCNATAADGAKIVVDHIKPVRYFWHLRYEANNLQVMCDSCNRGKGSSDQTDWREAK